MSTTKNETTFGYGKRKPRKNIIWQLIDYNDRIVFGNYALCRHIKNQLQHDGRSHRFQIIPMN